MAAACGPATPSLAPGSSGTQDAFGADLAIAVVEQLHADPFIGHIDQVATAQTTSGETTLQIEATLSVDISGMDTAFSMAFAGGGQNIQADMVLLDGEAFSRESGGTWAKGDGALVQSSLDGLLKAFRFVEDPSDLGYRGVESIEGRDLHRLTAVTEIPYVPAAGGTGTYDRFDIWVESDGTPVLIRSAFSATGPNGETIDGETDFTFSKVGGPIEIVSPMEGP
jgi:hypothetical protein